MAEQEELFEQEVEEMERKVEEEKKESAWYKERKSEITSTFFKALRLGIVEDALYWMLVMYENGGKFHIATLLLEMACEDVIDPQAFIYAKSIYDITGRIKECKNHLVRATTFICRAEKWYQSKQGREDVAIWQKCEEEIAQSKKSGSFRKIPRYGLDFFTKTGRKALDEKDWGKYCGKFSGSWKGWNNIAKFYQEGKLQDEIKKESIGIL